MPLHIETPTIEASWGRSETQSRTFLKLECLQPPGSFKIRGIGALCEHHFKLGKKKFVSSSGGNAGMAAAYAGEHLSLPVIVVVPESTTSRAIDLLKSYNADVIVHGPSWAEADAYARSLLDDEVAYIHPFDDPLLWTGYASMIDEVANSGLQPDRIILSVGGGGLLSGVLEGIERNEWDNCKVVAVETAGADSLAHSMVESRIIELDAIDSIASSLGAKRVSARAYSLAKKHNVESAVVSDLLAVKACRRFLDDHRMLVEPACGAALAWAYASSSCTSVYQSDLVIVCGGATATIEHLLAWEVELSSASTSV